VVPVDRRTVIRSAIALIVGAAVARVAWAAWIAHADPAAVRGFDTPGYLWPARALVEEGRFSLSPHDPTPMFVRTPGYPAFLAAILWLTDSVWAISLVQAAVSLLGVVAIALVGWRLLGPAAGLVAGALVALDPLTFVASGTIYTESAASVLVAAIVAVGGVVFAARQPRDVSVAAVVVLGALVAVVTLVRPTFWFYPAVLLALLAVRFRRLPRRSLAVRMLAFLVPILVVVGGWQVRNRAEVGSWNLSGVSSVNMYCWNAGEVEASVTGTTAAAARDRLGCGGFEAGPFSDCTRTAGVGCWMPDPEAPGQGFDAWGRKGVEIQLDHPVQTARMLAGGVVSQIVTPGRDNLVRYLGIGDSQPLVGVLSVWTAGLWAFAAIGAVAALRSTHRAFWVFVVATVGYVIVVSAGAAAEARFRIPIVPLLALLAALGLQHTMRYLRQGAAPPAAANEQRPLAGLPG
jgi:4-amino-4-deoxy-L-arabinose transferase-like glycosyltransferase